MPFLAGDPLDQIFDEFKSYIDTKLGPFKTSLPLQEDSPDAEAKKLRREVQAKKLKFKSNEKQLFSYAEIENHNSFALEHSQASTHRPKKALETSLDLIRKRQKLIKRADRVVSRPRVRKTWWLQWTVI